MLSYIQHNLYFNANIKYQRILPWPVCDGNRFLMDNSTPSNAQVQVTVFNNSSFTDQALCELYSLKTTECQPWPDWSLVLLGILQIMVNLSPRPDSTRRVGIAHFQLWGWRYPSCAQSNQLNQSERRKYAQLPWITTDPGNGLLSARRQAIAWTNFHLIINYTATNILQWFF